MAVKKKRFIRLLPGRIHKFKCKAWSSSGVSAWTDELPIRTSDVADIAWTVPDTEAAIKAVPKYWLRHIRVTWALIGQPLRFDHYLLFRYDMGVGPTYDTAARDAAIVQSGTDIDDGTYEDNANFLKDTGRLPLYIDKVSEDVDTAAAGDNNAVTEHRYDYWVYAIDIDGKKSSNYLGPDNAEFGKPATPELIIPTSTQESAYNIEADSDNFFVTEVKPLNKHWCDVRIAWNCPGGAEYYLIQYRRKNAILNPFKLWSFPLRLDHDTDEESYYESAYPLIEGGQNATLHTLMTNEDYEFRIKAVNIPIVLESGWSDRGEYRTERDPYPPAEVEDVSARRMLLFAESGLLSQKGEHIKIIWKRPDWALLREQINFYRIFRYKGTDSDAETVTDLINAWDGTGTLTYNSQNLLLDEKFLGTSFIDDDVLPLAEAGTVESGTALFEGATADARKTLSGLDVGPLIGTLQGNATISSAQAQEGTYSVLVSSAAGTNAIQWDDTTIIDLDEGYISLYFYANNMGATTYGEWPLFRTKNQLTFGANHMDIYYQNYVSTRHSIRVTKRSNSTLGILTIEDAQTGLSPSDAGTWIHVETRWSISAGDWEVRVNDGTWYSFDGFGSGSFVAKSGDDTGVLIGGAFGYNSPTVFNYYDNFVICKAYTCSTGQNYYHYWTAAVDTYEDLDNPGTDLEQQSVVSMEGVTITKADDDRYNGTSGSGESYDRVSFEKPDATTLVSPLASDGEGINQVSSIFGKKYTVKFKWEDVEEATYYRHKMRITPPPSLLITWPTTGWFFSPRIDQARANRDSDDDKPFWIHPVALEKGTIVEWTVVTGNMAGESIADTVSFEIIGDTTPPSKVTGLVGDCKGAGALSGLDLWLAVTLRWDALPNSEGVSNYQIYEDGIDDVKNFVVEVPHNRIAGALGTKQTAQILFRDQADFHVYRVRATDDTGVKGEFSDPLTVNFEAWWEF